METPLRLTPKDNPTLLEKIPVDIGAGDAAVRRESNSNEFPESTGVVVALSLCVPKRLQYRIRLEDLPLQKAQPTSGG